MLVLVLNRKLKTCTKHYAPLSSRKQTCQNGSPQLAVTHNTYAPNDIWSQDVDANPVKCNNAVLLLVLRSGWERFRTQQSRGVFGCSFDANVLLPKIDETRQKPIAHKIRFPCTKKWVALLLEEVYLNYLNCILKCLRMCFITQIAMCAKCSVPADDCKTFRQ